MDRLRPQGVRIRSIRNSIAPNDPKGNMNVVDKLAPFLQTNGRPTAAHLARILIRTEGEAAWFSPEG